MGRGDEVIYFPQQFNSLWRNDPLWTFRGMRCRSLSAAEPEKNREQRVPSALRRRNGNMRQRPGRRYPYCFGDDAGQLANAWYRIIQVSSRMPSDNSSLMLGLYDMQAMSGNVSGLVCCGLFFQSPDNGSARSGVGLGPGGTGRWLAQHSQGLPDSNPRYLSPTAATTTSAYRIVRTP